jgi:hypothetical protein
LRSLIRRQFWRIYESEWLGGVEVKAVWFRRRIGFLALNAAILRRTSSSPGRSWVESTRPSPVEVGPISVGRRQSAWLTFFSFAIVFGRNHEHRWRLFGLGIFPRGCRRCPHVRPTTTAEFFDEFTVRLQARARRFVGQGIQDFSEFGVHGKVSSYLYYLKSHEQSLDENLIDA